MKLKGEEFKFKKITQFSSQKVKTLLKKKSRNLKHLIVSFRIDFLSMRLS